MGVDAPRGRDFEITTKSNRTASVLLRCHYSNEPLPRKFMARHGHKLARDERAYISTLRREYDFILGLNTIAIGRIFFTHPILRRKR